MATEGREREIEACEGLVHRGIRGLRRVPTANAISLTNAN